MGKASDSTPTVNERPEGADDSLADTIVPRTLPAPVAPRSLDTTSSMRGRYEVGEEIARGGMGRVVEATDTMLGRTVAIKEVLSTDEDSLRRFARETKITARLEHPSIVPVYDAGTSADGSPFYAMRKVSGRPLEDLVAEAKTLDERLALLPHVLATAQAIAHAHSRRVLHRDLKPSNILVGSLGETVVIDWGLAKALDDPELEEGRDSARALSLDALKTRVGTVFGTPGFMSPEQVRGETVDARSDVYALGATLYYLLARRPPHAARTGEEMMVNALAGPPTPIGQMVTGVPPELSTIVDKALEYDAKRRYLDAGGFAEDLRRFLTGQLVASHRYSPRERIARFLKRHRLAVTVATIAAITLAVVATLAIRRVVRERNRADVALSDALDRNEQLVMSQAHTMVTTNPTAAVATIKPLASKHWREARAIGMAAHAVGVARGIRSTQLTTSVELTRDGLHALTASPDGQLLLLDLDKETSRRVAQVGPGMRAVFADDDRSIVTWAGTRIMIVEAATGTSRAIELGFPLASVSVQASQLWLVGSDGTVWTLGLTDAAPRKISVDDTIQVLSIAPTGAVALGGKRLWIVNGETASVLVEDGPIGAIAWSDDARQLAASIRQQQVAIVDVETARVVQHALASHDALLWDRGALLVGGVATVTRVTSTEIGPPKRVVEGTIIRLLHGGHGTVVAVSDIRTFAVLTEYEMAAVPPAAGGDAITTRANSPFVVAGSDGALLVWRLDAFVPRILPLPQLSLYSVIPGDQIIAFGVDQSRTWFDPATNQGVPMEPGPIPEHLSAAPSGTLLLLVEAGGRAALHRRGTVMPTKLDARVERGAFLSERQVVTSSPDGELRVYDTIDGSHRVIATGLPILELAVAGGDDGWIVVRRADHSLGRYHLATGERATLPAQPEPRLHVLTPEGNVYFAEGVRVRVWRRAGAIDDHATLSVPVSGFAQLIDPTRAMFGTLNVGASIVELGASNRVSDRFPPGSRMLDWNFGGDLLISRDAGGRVSIADLTSTVTWRLAVPASGLFTWTNLSSDGSRAFAFLDGKVATWDLHLPRTREETLQFLDELTNARGQPGRAALTWD